MTQTVRVEMPAHLCRLAGIRYGVHLDVECPITQRTVLDALERQFPALQGTIRDHCTKLRRPFIRFFACEQDLSHLSPDDSLPEPVAQGLEPLLIVGAIAGGVGSELRHAEESAEVPHSSGVKDYSCALRPPCLAWSEQL